MSPKERLLQLCSEGLTSKGLDSDAHYKTFLEEEIKDLNLQEEHEYFLELLDKKYRFPENENNLIMPWLIGLVDEFDITKESAFHPVELPDIDVDYLPVIQEYLRKVYCPAAFGRENVVNIGNYSTFGIKSALLDMARVHGIDRTEIQTITKNLEDRDDDGKPLTWEKALEITPALAKYCEEHPDVAHAAHNLINRNRGRGKHAGGTIISSTKIDNLVPVMIDTDGNPVSGWTEGLHEQDLQPVGLIKFDILSIKDLLRIAEICNLIKQRHPEITSICALPGDFDWTDISYLNDPKALKLANEAETKGIFQFGSKGIRNMVKAGGVDSFEDLAAYSALFRPGPLGMGMHERFIERKHGREQWVDEIPVAMLPVVDKTYGVMVYQEQVMKILNVIGDIPLIHCEKARKAMSKKKEKQFAKYKEKFLQNGSEKVGWPILPVAEGDTHNLTYLWDQIVSFSEYGFNKSHAVAYTYISSRLLWLKAHYPLEFYTITLRLENESDKVSAYKRDAEKMGILCERLDLNKSGVSWQIVDDKIYIGFSNVKGIGKEVAQEIVNSQPYSGFEDFLNRFGTDKRIVDPLIALSVTGNIFKECEPHLLEEFYEHFKKRSKGRKDREKRQMKRRQELIDTIKSVMPSGKDNVVTHEWLMECADSGAIPDFGSDDKDFDSHTLHVQIMKYAKSVRGFEQKEALDEEKPISFEGFQSITEDTNKFGSPTLLEQKHYGFGWEHPLQLSPDYSGDRGFSQFERETDMSTLGVEVMVKKQPQERESKKKHKYYYVLVEDEDSNSELVTFWDNDYQRFSEELNFWVEEEKRGHLFKLQLTRPGPGFKSYTFFAPPKHQRHLILPKDKENDARLQVMRPPQHESDILKSLRTE